MNFLFMKLRYQYTTSVKNNINYLRMNNFRVEAFNLVPYIFLMICCLFSYLPLF